MHSNANWHTVGSSWKQIVPKVHLLTLHLFIKLVKSNIQNASTLLLMTGKQGQLMKYLVEYVKVFELSS